MTRVPDQTDPVNPLHACRDTACAACSDRPPWPVPERTEPPEPVPVDPATSFARLEARYRSTPDLEQAAASILRPDRRRAKRHTSTDHRGETVSTFILHAAERSLVRSQAWAAEACETGAMTLQRVTVASGNPVAQRLSFRPRCCSRSCESCDALRRQHQASRTEGPWRLFLTVGVPSGAWSARDAWFQINGWIVSLMSRIRDEARRGASGDVRVCYPLRATWARDRELLYPDRRPPGLVRYAWVIEPHKSGYPHLHAVLTCDFIGAAWLKRVWGDTVGAQIKWCKLKLVTNQDGICRYLSKYITKTRLPAEILAVLGKGRMFACTLPRHYAIGGGWHPVTGAEVSRYELRVLSLKTSRPSDGWTISHLSPDRYCLASKPVSWSELAESLPDTSWTRWDQPSDPVEFDRFSKIYVSSMFELMGLDPSTGDAVGAVPSQMPPSYWSATRHETSSRSRRLEAWLVESARPLAPGGPTKPVDPAWCLDLDECPF